MLWAASASSRMTCLAGDRAGATSLKSKADRFRPASVRRTMSTGRTPNLPLRRPLLRAVQRAVDPHMVGPDGVYGDKRGTRHN